MYNLLHINLINQHYLFSVLINTDHQYKLKEKQ